MRRFALFALVNLLLCAGVVIVLAENSATSPSTQPTTAPSALKPVNVHFMVRGYCYAGSRIDKKALGGFGPSDNSPADIPKQLAVRAGQIELIVVTAPVAFAQSYQGVTLYLVNSTKKEASFNACDSRISIVQEALDTDGTWKPIEYLPSSWCGNSYHHVFLPASACWSFAAPQYAGERATKLRFQLDPGGDQKSITSNEFEGSINPEQFTQKQGHQATNIMDPYND